MTPEEKEELKFVTKASFKIAIGIVVIFTVAFTIITLLK
jgi:hypothetical protein